MTVTVVLISLTLFQVKHYLADYHWQTAWMIESKSRYGHPGGLAHALLHSTLSIPALVIAYGGWSTLVGLLLIAEFLIHYHIDWFKVYLGVRREISSEDRDFWRLVGLDQMAHQFTYICMLMVVFWAS